MATLRCLLAPSGLVGGRQVARQAARRARAPQTISCSVSAEGPKSSAAMDRYKKAALMQFKNTSSLDLDDDCSDIGEAGDQAVCEADNANLAEMLRKLVDSKAKYEELSISSAREKKDLVARIEQAEWELEVLRKDKDTMEDNLKTVMAQAKVTELSDNASAPGYSAEEHHAVVEERDRALSELSILERKYSMAEADNESLRMEVAALELTLGSGKEDDEKDELETLRGLLDSERARATRLEGQLRLEVQKKQADSVPGLAFARAPSSYDSMDEEMTISERAQVWLAVNGANIEN